MAFRAASELRVKTVSGTGQLNLVGPSSDPTLPAGPPSGFLVASNNRRSRSPSYAQTRRSFSTRTNHPSCARHPPGCMDAPYAPTSTVRASRGTRTFQIPPTECSPNLVMNWLVTTAGGAAVPSVLPPATAECAAADACSLWCAHPADRNAIREKDREMKTAPLPQPQSNLIVRKAWPWNALSAKARHSTTVVKGISSRTTFRAEPRTATPATSNNPQKASNHGRSQRAQPSRDDGPSGRQSRNRGSLLPCGHRAFR